MTTKQRIETNKAKLKQLTNEVDTISILIKNKDEKKAIDFLLEKRKEEIEARISAGENENAYLEKQYEKEYELLSAEANMNLEKLVNRAQSWVGKDPVGITSKLLPLIEAFKGGISDQQTRNDVYTELLGHMNFLTNTYKNK